MRYRRAEHGHDSIPDKLLDETVVVLNHRGHFPEQIALESPDILGIEALAQCREARDVGEQHAYQPSIGLCRILCSAGLRRPIQ
jgi:hypothetical protein